MVATNLKRYENVKDKHGVTVGSWAVQVEPGYFKCTICKPVKTLCFKQGKGELTKHSESQRHRENYQNSSKSHQPSVLDLINKREENEVKEKATDFEIALATFYGVHGIPLTSIKCLVDLIKNAVPESEMLRKVKLGETKAHYLINQGIGKEYSEKTVDKLKHCIAFGASIDESEVNKVSQMEITVKVATKEGVEYRHFKTLDLEAGDAQTITDTFVDAFEDENISLNDGCIDVATDGCNTMTGEKSGVITRISKKFEGIYFTGSCGAHNASNTMQHATESFDGDLKMALVDIYFDIGGAPGKGTKRMKEFKSLCKERGHIPKQFKKFISTRFRSLRTCIGPVLDNYDEIVNYYTNVKNTVKKPSPRRNRLIEMFVIREEMSRLKFEFIYAATLDFTEKIDFFESRAANVHNTADTLEDLLFGQLNKFVDESELTVYDEGSDEIKRKTRKELANLDVNTLKVLSEKSIFIGRDTTNYMKTLGLSPTSKQLAWFYEKVRKFYQTAIKYLLKYYGKALRSDLMESFTALNPNKQSHVLTPVKLKHLASKYSKVVDNIDAINGHDKLMKEITSYQTDRDIKEFDLELLNFESFWLKVGKLTDGVDWPRYEVLPYFAIGLSVKFNSNSEVERQFSLMNNIHQNRQRNCMSQESLNSYLHIKSGAGGIENRKKCSDCTHQKNNTHCHCNLVEISDSLRSRCRRARAQYFDSLQESKNIGEKEKEEMKVKKAATEKRENERKLIRKEKLAKCTHFFSSSLLEPVYSNVDEKSKSKNSDKENNKDNSSADSNKKSKDKNNESSSADRNKKSKDNNKENSSADRNKKSKDNNKENPSPVMNKKSNKRPRN